MEASLISLFLCVLLRSCYTSQNELIVDTTSGPVEGFSIKSFNDKNVNVYLGIPYGQPPTGDLRFNPPVKVNKSINVINAKKKSKSCVQMPSQTIMGLIEINFIEDWFPDPSETSEDCLFLNVWAPSPMAKEAAVMLWIHGGGFESGSPNSIFYDGQILATKGVVVVSLNYRLSVFGFLTLDSEESPGNVGLMDQALAFEWVRDNIANFGGSPNKVTVFGESAGAGSIGHHLTLPSNRGLFQRAILQSGATTSPWNFSNKKSAAKVARQFVEAAGCLSTTPKDMVHCLREKSESEIASIVQGIKSENGPQLLRYVPVVDGTYLVDDPNKLLAELKLNNVDVLLGASIDDAAFMPILSKSIPKAENPLVDEETFVRYVKSLLGDGYNHNLQEILKFQYTDWEDVSVPKNWRSSIANFANDIFIKCGMNTLANSVVLNGNKVYYYQLEHRISISKMPSWIRATHTDEIPFVFGIPLLKPEIFTAEEVAFSEKVVNYWTNFAKTGDPNGEGELWPPYTAENKLMFRLNLTDSVQKGSSLRNCAFITQLLPKLMADD